MIVTLSQPWPTGETAAEWTPPTEQRLVNGKLPAGWSGEKYWLDLVPGAQVELPGHITFKCFVDLINDFFELRLAYQMGEHAHELTAELNTYKDLSLITGFPCLLIPRIIKPASSDLPAAIQLEFAHLVSQ